MTTGPKPFLRWAGSKKKQLPILARFWNTDFSRYVEPFMGSACLFFRLQPKVALLADINEHLINTFLAVRDHPQAVSNRITKIPLGKRSYYSVRKQQASNADGVDAAARFIFLNRFCFNGLYRTNLRGEFNVPYAPSGTGSISTRETLVECSRYLKNATLKAAHFAVTLSAVQRGDFVYLDPPYAVASRRVFREYDPSGFSIRDLERLADCLREIHAKGAQFVLTYAFCKEAVEIFDRWQVTKCFTQRHIAGFASHRRKAGELLVTNCQNGIFKS